MRRRIVMVLAVLVACSMIGPAAGLAGAAGDPVRSDGDRVSVTAATHGTPAADGGCGFPVTASDGLGTVTLEEEPERVVTLNPSAAQTMWEIGAADKVVGVTKHASNLEGAGNRTNISDDGRTISPEIVVDLEPDLVLAPSSQTVSEELVRQLREAGLTVYHYQSAESIDDVREQTLTTGELVGECAGAAETVEWMDREIGIVEAAVDGQERPDVLYTFFGYTAGEETFIDEIVSASGATNVAAEVGIDEYQEVNEEVVVEEDPDWIVLNSESPSVPDGEAYEGTTAVRENQTVVVDINHLNRPGPRIVHAISTLAETFHPDAYAVAREQAAGTPSPSSAQPDGEPVEAADDADDQPGFGVPIALVVALLATLGAKRRSADDSSDR